MSDLISRTALLESYDIAKMVEYDETGCGVTRIAIPVQAIKDAPAVDAVPVVHAKWVFDRPYHYKCSACNNMWSSVAMVMSYCPNCGAKMDGGLNEKE